jgi:predicted nucleotidyltransferase
MTVRVPDMKKLKELKAQLEALKPLLVERYKVESIAIFGSYSRGEQTPKSDLDIMVTFSEPIGVYRFIEVEEFLGQKLGIKVDLVQKGALLPMIKDQILNETINI